MIVSERSSSKAKSDLRASGNSYLASVLSGKKLKIDDMMVEEPKTKPVVRVRSAKKKPCVHEDLIRLKKLTCN